MGFVVRECRPHTQTLAHKARSRQTPPKLQRGCIFACKRSWATTCQTSRRWPSPHKLAGESTCEKETPSGRVAPLSEASEGQSESGTRKGAKLINIRSQAGAPKPVLPVQERSARAARRRARTKGLARHPGLRQDPTSRTCKHWLQPQKSPQIAPQTRLPSASGVSTLSIPSRRHWLPIARLRLDARQMYREARTIGEHILQTTTMPLANNNILGDVVSVEEQKLDRVVPRLAAVPPPYRQDAPTEVRWHHFVGRAGISPNYVLGGGFL